MNMIDRSKICLQLNLRERFADDGLEGAINIPYAEIESRCTELSREIKIIFVCHTGSMGVQSGQLLLKNGYEQVYNLAGGMVKWNGDKFSCHQMNKAFNNENHWSNILSIGQDEDDLFSILKQYLFARIIILKNLQLNEVSFTNKLHNLNTEYNTTSCSIIALLHTQ